MNECLYELYESAYDAASLAVVREIEAALHDLVDLTSSMTSSHRRIAMLAIEDATRHRPKRGRVHVCRLHMPGCAPEPCPLGAAPGAASPPSDRASSRA